MNQVASGEHSLIALHDGYPTWAGSVIVQGPTTLNVDLIVAAIAQQRDVEDRLQKVADLIGQSQFDDAKAQCKALLLEYPGNHEVLETLWRLNEAEVNAAQDWASAKLGQATGYYQNRYYQAALTLCDEVLRSQPTNSAALHLKDLIQKATSSQ